MSGLVVPVHQIKCRLNPSSNLYDICDDILNITRPAESSDNAEDLPLLEVFLNLPPFRIILQFFSFFQTLLVIANNIHRHIEVLLFSTSFVISVLFGDVKTESLLVLRHRQKKYLYIFQA